jgi:hypothetical protein
LHSGSNAGTHARIGVYGRANAASIHDTIRVKSSQLASLCSVKYSISCCVCLPCFVVVHSSNVASPASATISLPSPAGQADQVAWHDYVRNLCFAEGIMPHPIPPSRPSLGTVVRTLTTSPASTTIVCPPPDMSSLNGSPPPTLRREVGRFNYDMSEWLERRNHRQSRRRHYWDQARVMGAPLPTFYDWDMVSDRSVQISVAPPQLYQRLSRSSMSQGGPVCDKEVSYTQPSAQQPRQHSIGQFPRRRRCNHRRRRQGNSSTWCVQSPEGTTHNQRPKRRAGHSAPQHESGIAIGQWAPEVSATSALPASSSTSWLPTPTRCVGSLQDNDACSFPLSTALPPVSPPEQSLQTDPQTIQRTVPRALVQPICTSPRSSPSSSTTNNEQTIATLLNTETVQTFVIVVSDDDEDDFDVPDSLLDDLEQQ